MHTAFNAIMDTAPSVREKKGFEIQTGIAVYIVPTPPRGMDRKEGLVDW